MNVWLFEISDFVPGVDSNQRPFRCGMLAKALVQRGHNVRWWTSTFNHQLRKNRFPGSRDISLGTGLTVHFLYGPGYQKSASISRWWHNRTVAAAFRRIGSARAREECPDLIYACIPTLEVAEDAVRVAMMFGVPSCIDVRELWPDNYLTLLPSWARPIGKVVFHREFMRARWILSHAAAVIGTSEAYLKWGLRLARRPRSLKDKVFPLGAPDVLAQPKPANDGTQRIIGSRMPQPLVVVFAGTFTRLFDLDTAIDAAKELDAVARGRVLFRLVGDGEQRRHIESLAQGLRNVELLGWRDHVDLSKVLQSAHVGLAPYESHIEPTLPNKPFEYLAAGIPVLSSARGELHQLIAQE